MYFAFLTMTDFYIGLATTAVLIAILEIFGFFEKRLMASLTLVGIPFIYIGFSWPFMAFGTWFFHFSVPLLPRVMTYSALPSTFS